MHMDLCHRSAIIQDCFGKFRAFVKEALIKSFGRLRANDTILIPFVVSLSNPECN